MDRSGVTVVIPALNEESRLPLVLAEIPPDGSILVVDNGSTDRTASVARLSGAHVVEEKRRGYGSACLAGIAEAERLGTEVLVILDADHSDHADELPMLTDPVLRGEFDLVIGDRTALADKDSLFPQQRHGNALATRLIAVATGHRYRDMGPSAIRMDALRRLEMRDPTQMERRDADEGHRPGTPRPGGPRSLPEAGHTRRSQGP